MAQSQINSVAALAARHSTLRRLWGVPQAQAAARHPGVGTRRHGAGRPAHTAVLAALRALEGQGRRIAALAMSLVTRYHLGAAAVGGGAGHLTMPVKLRCFPSALTATTVARLDTTRIFGRTTWDAIAHHEAISGFSVAISGRRSDGTKPPGVE